MLRMTVNWLVLLLALGLSLHGCGDEESQSDDENGPQATGARPDTSPRGSDTDPVWEWTGTVWTVDSFSDALSMRDGNGDLDPDAEASLALTFMLSAVYTNEPNPFEVALDQVIETVGIDTYERMGIEERVEKMIETSEAMDILLVEEEVPRLVDQGVEWGLLEMPIVQKSIPFVRGVPYLNVACGITGIISWWADSACKTKAKAR